MAYTSIADWELRLNGHLVTGLADDRQAVQFPEIDRLLTEYSAEGFVLQTLSGMRGGNLIVTLMAGSVSLRKFGEWHTAMLKNRIITISGTARNTQWGIDCALSGGAMKAGPSFPNWGSGIMPPLVYRLHFESIVGNMSGLNSGLGAGQTVEGITVI